MPTTVTQTLTSGQFAAITDFTDLWLEFTANVPPVPGDTVVQRDGTVITLRDGTTVVTTIRIAAVTLSDGTTGVTLRDGTTAVTLSS